MDGAEKRQSTGFDKTVPILSGYLRGLLKFIYSEKATKFSEIFTLLLTGPTQDKSKVKISQNFVAFSEYMNFIQKHYEFIGYVQSYIFVAVCTFATFLQKLATKNPAEKK